ncbi:MAG TPA: discoidin domain-containing protein, partial [Phycisphaerales bacterium]|nr:discoidin domain-containing protein [Phycisphaerales bacterium]
MRRIIMFRKVFNERAPVMFKRSVYLIAAISVLSWTALAGAGDFVEDFESYQVHALLNDLPNWTTVVYGAAGTEISGGDYFIDNINGSQRLHSPRGGGTLAVINPDVLTLGKGTDLDMSVDIYYNGVAIGNGLIFYYQDQNNFYYVEMVAPNNANSFRFIKRVGGSNQTIFEQAPAGLELNTEYRLHVQYKAASNTFDIRLETLSDGNIVQEFENVADDTFRGGQVGVWANSSFNGSFDNLTVVMPSGTAGGPSPADGATDVRREVVLSWEPGESAGQHDVYFGTSFDDVNSAAVTVDLTGVYRGRQSANSYAVPERLDLGQTYYWRIDEVNAAPDNAVFRGSVWQFTAEPVAYTIENVTVTASSANRDDESPENTINGSGLDDSGLHSSESTAMWLSSGTDPNPTWIRYEFDRVHKLYQMLLWNYNTSVEPLVGFGIKEATIEYSVDGTDWSVLGTTHEFAKGPGLPGYASNTTIDLEGAAARHVRITANSNWGGILNQYGLSEVRFSSIPVVATEPSPNSGTAEVSADAILSFRAGREAATHNVYLSTD